MEPLIVYDRSRVTTDWICPRKRYWQYEYDGKGVVNGNTSLAPYIGNIIHDGLAAIAHGVADIDEIATIQSKLMYDSLMSQMAGENETEAVEFAREQAALVEGIIRGFYKQVWPQQTKQYPKIIAIEPELRYDHDDLVFMSRPDLVVEDAEGDVWYIEYKTTSSKRENWVNSWDTAIQLHSTIRAIESTLGLKVTGVLVQGLYKGFESYGKQSSPFCYAYRRAANPPFIKAETTYEYRAGFKRFPTWELPGGVKAWVEGMPDSVLADQFPQVPPIFIKDELVDKFFQQRAYREREISLASRALQNGVDQGILDMCFPQHFDQCADSYGKPCAYRRICHGGVTDPLAEGFEYRIPHHQMELELQNVSK
jgi:hypothetical protein